MATAWVLNLDADLELAAGPGYAPTRKLLETMRPRAAWLAERLLPSGDVWLRDDAWPEVRGLAGRAFCPTPRALATMRRAGVVPEPHPSVEVLRRVNGRGFCHALGPTLPGAAFVRDLDEALAILASEPPEGDGWRVKRAFGMAGRNQRVARGDLAFLPAWLDDGAMLEPNVAIVAEYARHAMLEPSGAWTMGRLVRQRCDAQGQWLSTEPVLGLEIHTGVDAEADAADARVPDDARVPAAATGASGEAALGTFREAAVAKALEAEVRRVALALHEVGYFGPFGVDAFTYRARDGSIRLQPRSEINARYSMGFAVGMLV
jgi:hypothetical protein